MPTVKFIFCPFYVLNSMKKRETHTFCFIDEEKRNERIQNSLNQKNPKISQKPKKKKYPNKNLKKISKYDNTVKT